MPLQPRRDKTLRGTHMCLACGSCVPDGSTADSMTGMRVMPMTTVSGPSVQRDEGVVMPWLM